MDLGDLSTSALFLDLDGTLIDIAQTPDEVVIPRELVGLLADVTRLLGGALAILTGRRIADIDRYLADPAANAPKSATTPWGKSPRSRFPLPPGPPLG
ncbi:MAG TPA: trehalose-phosphatase, partial [Phenylobacterium sp.]|nr:trehalose-phosphatase [Phenylobacterium sp.]